MSKKPLQTETPITEQDQGLSSGHDVPQGQNKSVELREKISSIVSNAVGVNNNKSVQIAEQIFEVVAEEYFKGPIPHPKHLAHYEQICPGLAERMMKMAESDQSRSLDLRDKLVDYEYTDRRTGMWLGFFALVLIIAAGSAITIYGNKYIGGGLLATSAIGAVISPFVNGRRPLPTLRSTRQAVDAKRPQKGAPASKNSSRSPQKRRRN